MQGEYVHSYRETDAPEMWARASSRIDAVGPNFLVMNVPARPFRPVMDAVTNEYLDVAVENEHLRRA